MILSSKVNKNFFDFRFIFHQLVNKAARERQYVSTDELSLDARALHDQLPDLDYMLSDVLLFSVTNR